MTDDTRARILRAALEEFSERGFHATSVRELAERVGVTKTAVLYHFPGKADIVTALAEPLLDDLEAAMAKAADAADPRAAAIEGLLGVWLRHRYLLRMNLRDLGLTASTAVFERFRDGMLTANRLVAGPDADLAGRVRAAQAIAMLSDPVVLFADAPVAELRAAVLDGVDRLYAVAEDRPRARRGRPTVMSPETIEAARRLYDAGHAPSDIATALGVSRATIYRHLPGVE
ncbi:TetR family transcriptional regulator [Amycolatopsis sp. SID8362]|uniref:TetR family transcriptional regulator n=1 Tax=Amycolatopsis sp. SID8362 TaxID=2690346 RepID=UPI00136AFA4F|nr:TetR family transcriptional regulator [Amycolatopsis sp. SID8362]NBH12227.1 TetR family transcriptional regulator [Amycolatopsis sp. SID8362]NED48919.1 TetR family transcriptional regulator [Amycolatopsis sp. SID8362]